jgi:hypothetical protein
MSARIIDAAWHVGKPISSRNTGQSLDGRHIAAQPM